MCKITLVVLSPGVTGLRIMGQKLHPDNPPVASMDCLTTAVDAHSRLSSGLKTAIYTV